jgi:hypothetical protein
MFWDLLFGICFFEFVSDFEFLRIIFGADRAGLGNGLNSVLNWHTSPQSTAQTPPQPPCV